MNTQSINYSTAIYLSQCRNKKRKNRLKEIWTTYFPTKKYVLSSSAATIIIDYIGFDRYIPYIPQNRYLSHSFS